MDFIRNLMTLKAGFFAVFIAVIINLIIIDSFLIRGGPTRIIEKITEVSSSKPQLTPKPIDENSCPVSCISQIKEATASTKISQTPTPKPESKIVSQPTESIIPFGSGVNSTDDWQDVSGAQTYIDSTKYGRIKKVTFEAYVRIPTGNQTAYARLFNVTDKHPVWFSEVSLTGGTPQLFISGAITLDSGNKLYQVQMKTSLKFQAFLDSSRVRITSE